MAAQTTFPKKDGRICALVPQKARAWGVITCKLIKRVYAKQLTRNYHVSINLILGPPLNGNTEQIGNTDK